MPFLSWTGIFLFVLPCVARITGLSHCAKLSLDFFYNFFIRICLLYRGIFIVTIPISLILYIIYIFYIISPP
jgi:hypothetical protein